MKTRHAKLFGSLFVVLAVGGGAALTLSSRASADAAASGPTIGAAAPAFELKDQDGKTVKLSDYADKVVVLEWFNNECPFVQKHYKTGSMNATAAKYEAKGVVWLAIDSTKTHDSSNAKKVIGEWKIDHAILDDSAGTVGHLYDAKSTPDMYVIDHGKLVYSGAIDSKPSTETEDLSSATNYVAQALDEVLAGKSVSTPVTKSYGCSVKYAS